MKRIIKLTVFLVLVSLVLFVVGSQVMAASNVLRLITWSGYAPEELIAKFKAETGIEVQVILSNNEEMISKLRATRGGGFDLAQPSQDRISSVVAEYGIYQPIDYSKVDVDQLDPSLLAAVKKNTLVDGKSYGVPHVYGTSGLIVNFEKAPDVKDYKDLLDPKYTGRVSYRMKRPTLIAMGFSFGYDPFELYNNLEDYQKFLDDISEKLIAGKAVLRNYWDNGDQLLESMRSGEVWAAMAWEQAGWKLHDENPNIDYLAPTSGALAWVDTFTIPAKSENVEGAYKWINFMLRPENAAVFTNLDTTANASKGANRFLEPAIRSNFERSFPLEAIVNIKWYPPVSAKIEGIEGMILDKVKAAK